MKDKMINRMRSSEEDMLKKLMKMGGKGKMAKAEVDVEVDDEMEDGKKKIKKMDKKMMEDSDDEYGDMSREELLKKIRMMKK